MMILNRLATILALVALLAPGPLPLEASTRKGDKLLKQGREAEARKEYDKALDLYEQALNSDPMDTAYQMAVNRVRFQASQVHVQMGKSLRADGKLDEALKEFQKAFAIDPSSTIAEQEMRRTIQIIERVKREAEGGKAEAEQKPEDYNLSPGQAARKASEEHAAAIRGVPDLRPLSPQITNLKIVNQTPKVLFETIGKLAGVNILFDAEYQDQGKRYSIDLNRTNLSDALDYAALLTKSFWKPLSSNTIFVTNDNPTKRRDYEEHVTRVFYLQNITTPQELQEIMTAMRQVTDIRKIFPFNSQSALVVRGTADQMALAEKVVLDLDKPKPEVVVDVMVFEASRTKTRELGIGLSTAGISIPFSFTPNGTSTGTGSGTANTSIPANQIGRLSSSDWSVVLPGASLQALLSDGNTRVLQSPQVRATDGQKASLKLGDRYPYATGSFQPGVGSVGVSPLVSTQFQFADVGVNVDVTPRIHGADEVSMQVELEVSNIRERINVGGLEQPVIGQRKVSHIIRVKEGQATLIGGLMGATERKTRSGIPGLVDIPGIGRIFGTDKLEVSNNDLLVVLMPHIVRYPELTADNLKPVASGTEAIYKISYDQRNGKAEPAPVAPTGLPQGPPALAVPGLPSAATPSATPAAPSPEQPQTPPTETPGAAAVAPPPPAEAVAATPAQPSVQLIASAPETPLNSNITVRVNVENVKDLFASPMKVTFDNKVLKLVDIRRGPFLSGDGAQVTFDQTKVDNPGMAIVGMNRVAGSGGVSGSGTLVTLVFQAVGQGSTEIKFDELTLRDAKLQSITVTPPVARVTVK